MFFSMVQKTNVIRFKFRYYHERKITKRTGYNDSQASTSFNAISFTLQFNPDIILQKKTDFFEVL